MAGDEQMSCPDPQERGEASLAPSGPVCKIPRTEDAVVFRAGDLTDAWGSGFDISSSPTLSSSPFPSVPL